MYLKEGENFMANIKSAKKSIIQDAKRTEANKSVRSKIKNDIKRIEAAVVKGDKDLAQAELKKFPIPVVAVDQSFFIFSTKPVFLELRLSNALSHSLISFS